MIRRRLTVLIYPTIPCPKFLFSQLLTSTLVLCILAENKSIPPAHLDNIAAARRHGPVHNRGHACQQRGRNSGRTRQRIDLQREVQQVRRYREEGIEMRLLQHQKLGGKSREAYSSGELCLVPVKIIADWSQQRSPCSVNDGWLMFDD